MKWEHITLVVHGNALAEETTTEVVTSKNFSPGRAIATGGMIKSKKTRTESTSTERSREGFLHIYAPGTIAVVRETAVDYGGLGSALQVSRSANFMGLLAMLRERAPQARFDDRLLKLVGQAQVLGNVLDPLRHIRLASALIAAAAAAQAR